MDSPQNTVMENKAYKEFIEALLTAPDVLKPEDPDIGKIEELSPENFQYVSSIIKICQKVSDEQIESYVSYLNNAFENSGEFKKFVQMASRMETTQDDEEFL